MRRAACLLLTLSALAASSSAARADDEAAALVRRADETTYLPARAGVKSLQCSVRYTMTNGTVRRMAYTYTAAAAPPSHVDRLLDAGEREWDSAESEERYCNAIDRLVWKDWRAMTAGCELEVRREADRPVVVVKSAPEEADVNTGDELTFLPEGPVERCGAAHAKRDAIRIVRDYEPEGERFAAKSGVIEGYGGGLERWTWMRTKEILLPKTYTLNCGGLGGTFVFDDWRIDQPPSPVRGSAGSPAEELAADLADPDIAVRLRAAGQLERLGEKAAPAADALVAVVDELASPRARDSRDTSLLARTALRALASCRKRGAAASGTLVGWIDDSDPEIADGALRCLVWIGSTPAEAVPKLIPLIAKPWPEKGPDPVRTRWAVAAIWNSGPAAEAAIPSLVALLDAKCEIGRTPREFKPSDFRDAAAQLLGTLKPAAVSVLIARLSQPNVEMSDHFAGHAVSALGADAKAVVDKFVPDLASAERRTRALHVLRCIGTAASGATAGLMAVLRDDPDAKTRLNAAWALGWVATKDPAAAASVVSAWRDGRIAGEIRTVPSRRTILDDTMYAFAATAVAPLTAAVREMKDDPRGLEAAYLLGHCGEAAIPALATLAADADPAIGVRGIRGLGVVIGDAAVPELLKLLAADDEARAAAVIDALVVNSFPAAPALEELRKLESTSALVRERADEALRRIAAK